MAITEEKSALAFMKKYDEDEAKYINEVEPQILKLKEIILENWEEKVRKAQEEKLNQVCLFQFGPHQKMDGYNEEIIHLFNDRRWNKTAFKSILARLYDEISIKNLKLVYRIEGPEITPLNEPDYSCFTQAFVEVTWVTNENEWKKRECSICYEMFFELEQIHNYPTAAQKNHTCCFECLLQMHIDHDINNLRNKRTRAKFPCPFCRKRTRHLDNGKNSRDSDATSDED